MSGIRKAAPSALLALVAAGVAPQIGAADQPAVAGASAGNDASGTLDEVVVTAQRRAERLQDVPITITNISGTQLVDAGIQDLAGIMAVTPALRFDHNANFFQPSIRGVSTTVVSSGGGANVGIYIDGYYSPNPQAADSQLLNVDSIQVLKGPQGTLFGRNTSGGAILVTTSQPSEKTSGIVDASYGSNSAQRYQGYFTTGLFDHVAMDLAGSYSKGDGYFTNIVNNDNKVGAYKNWQIRTGLKVDFSDSLSVLLRYEHESVNDPTSVMNNTWVSGGQALDIGAINPAEILATKPGQVSFNPKYVPDFTADNDVVQLTPTLDLGFASLTSYTQYRQEKDDFSQNTSFNLLGVFAHVPIHDRTITQEFLLSSKPGSRLQWTTGAFYLDYTDLFHVTLSIFGSPPILGPGSNTDTVSAAVFGDATYQLTDNLYLTAGLRYSHDELKDVYQILFPGEAHALAPNTNGNKVIPRAVVRYAFTPDSSVYASFTQGYKAGIYDLGGVALKPVAPESMTAYEVGYKYASQALSFNLASYYYNYTNLQVSNYSVNAQGVGVAQISNAANARIYGFEGDVAYKVYNHLEINAGAAYTNAKYSNWTTAPDYTPCFISAAVCGASYGTLVQSQFNASGLQMQRAPPFTATLGPRYTNELAGGHLALSATLYYTSNFFYEPVRLTEQSPYATLGLRAEWTDPSDRYTLAVYGENVADKRYTTQGQTGNTGVYAAWAAPATFGGEVRVQF